MNLKNFEEYFEAKILNRGKKYYLTGAVLSIEKIAEYEYSAEVEGSETYEVTVYMDNAGKINDVTCDCPYDMGEYCKHQAAVLYALRNENQRIIQTSAKQANLSQLLGKCNHTQLVEIILEHAKKDKGFKNYLYMKLSENSDSRSIIADFKRIFNGYFKGHSDIDEVLKAGELLIDKTEKLDSVIERVSVYAEVILLLENACYSDYDEESWGLFETINECVSYMEAAVKNIVNAENSDDIEAAWGYVINHWGKDYMMDVEEYFFPSLLQFCTFPEYRIRLDELLVVRAASSDGYRKRKIDEQRFSIIKKYGTEAEIADYINSHLDNADFRRRAIERAIDVKNYTEAEQLALDGIQFNATNYPTVTTWHYLLHDIYKLSENKHKLIETCRIMVKNGETDYYEEWKSLIPEKNRHDEIEYLLNESMNISYEYIIAYENRSDRIYQLCCKYPHKITDYYEKLKATEFGQQSKELYEQYIRNEGNRVASRSEYAALCKKLKEFSMECDAELAIKIASDFRELYRRRPAFMDELRQAGF